MRWRSDLFRATVLSLSILLIGSCKPCIEIGERERPPADAPSLIAFVNQHMPAGGRHLYLTGLTRINGPRGTVEDASQLKVDFAGSLDASLAKAGMPPAARGKVRASFSQTTTATLENPSFYEVRYRLDPIEALTRLGGDSEIESCYISRMIAWEALAQSTTTTALAQLKADLGAAIDQADAATATGTADKLALADVKAKVDRIALDLSANYQNALSIRYRDAVEKIETDHVTVLEAQRFEIRPGVPVDDPDWFRGVDIIKYRTAGNDGFLDLSGQVSIRVYSGGKWAEASDASNVRAVRGDVILFARRDSTNHIYSILKILDVSPELLKFRAFRLGDAILGLADSNLLQISLVSWSELPNAAKAADVVLDRVRRGAPTAELDAQLVVQMARMVSSSLTLLETDLLPAQQQSTLRLLLQLAALEQTSRVTPEVPTLSARALVESFLEPRAPEAFKFESGSLPEIPIGDGITTQRIPSVEGVPFSGSAYIRGQVTFTVVASSAIPQRDWSNSPYRYIATLASDTDRLGEAVLTDGVRAKPGRLTFTIPFEGEYRVPEDRRIRLNFSVNAVGHWTYRDGNFGNPRDMIQVERVSGTLSRSR